MNVVKIVKMLTNQKKFEVKLHRSDKSKDWHFVIYSSASTL